MSNSERSQERVQLQIILRLITFVDSCRLVQQPY